MRRVKIFYGLSGTLKSTTIKATWKYPYYNGSFDQIVFLWSQIKTWKEMRNKLFPWLANPRETNLNYALLHLTQLIEKYKKSIIGDVFVIERGVSDMLYYESRVDSKNINDLVCRETVDEELNILGDGEVEKILLMMKDSEFIQEKVLTEPTRGEWFKTPEEYLGEQEKYIEFTKKFNKINKEIVIEDARKYLGDLGLEYNV